LAVGQHHPRLSFFEEDTIFAPCLLPEFRDFPMSSSKKAGFIPLKQVT